MAVGRLQAALAAATNEVTVAAANFNFDFTLVKYEAPKEYQALGSVLSSKRKDNAEHGSSHITARQLGALFEGVCPLTPGLLEAYGTRASEIARASKSISEPYVSTLFAEYTGIDGTSIWAAATSSKAALHVHLLACMLARMWTAPEAVAIWVELVAERKRDIANKVDADEGVSFSLAAAVGQEITRPQLAAWDASARAWLRTADGVQQRNQKQLELIVKNFDFPINGDSKVYPSVATAWSTAVETMDKLVAGMPQEVQNGATLLGLSAWHLYPDISVFGSQIVPVKMNDPLISRGGVLSLGLSATPRTSSNGNGVYWSLSLAHLRHYGRPVHSERVLQSGSRVSFSQLKLVVFSTLLAEWDLSETDSELTAKAVLRLVDCVRGNPKSESDDEFLQLLQDGASAFLNRSAGDQNLNRKLIQLGRRRAHSFFHKPDEEPDESESPGEDPVLFGLLNPICFMKALKDCDARISALRHIATQLRPEAVAPDTFIIRYRHDISNPLTVDNTLLHSDSQLPDGDSDNDIPGPVGSLNEFINNRPSLINDHGNSEQTLLPSVELESSALDFNSGGMAKHSPSDADVGRGSASNSQEPREQVEVDGSTNTTYIDSKSTASDICKSDTDFPKIPGNRAFDKREDAQKLNEDVLGAISNDSRDRFQLPGTSDHEQDSGELDASNGDGHSGQAFWEDEGSDVVYGSQDEQDEDSDVVYGSQHDQSSFESSRGPSPESTQDAKSISGYAFATALPLESQNPSETSKRDASPNSPVHHHHRWLPSHPHNALLLSGESYTLDAAERFKSSDYRVEILGAQADFSYRYLLGNASEAALYLRRGPERPRILDNSITLEYFHWCLDNNLFDPTILLRLLLYTTEARTDCLRKSLVALACAASIYNDLPEATIDTGILSRQLIGCHWARNIHNEFRVCETYPVAFSLISYFESGTHDIDPDQLSDVIALSHTNSLFVCLPMIQDPSKSIGKLKSVRRILGNVGKPGLSFLLPPQEPMTREVNSDSWRVNSYRSFDGSSAQSFRSTSVHLSFTDFHVHMYDGSRGAHDNQISFLESVISVRDRGEWVADIDPLPLLRSVRYIRQVELRNLDIQAPCNHPKESNPNSDIVAVDSWDELLDTPDGIIVIRTGENWVARLALTMVAIQQLEKFSKPYAVTVCPNEVCWTCVQQNFVHHAYIF